MKLQPPHHTVLFNVAAYTVLKLSVAEGKRIYNYIEEIMNGDGLYKGATKETILEAYHDQYNAGPWTWVELIQELQTELDSEPITSGPWAVRC
jgi:hypothetical protein